MSKIKDQITGENPKPIEYPVRWITPSWLKGKDAFINFLINLGK